MYWPGHVGAALLLYAPVGTALNARAGTVLAAVGTGTAVLFSTLPDIDKQLPVEHRGPTHTLWFAAGVAVAAGLIGLLGGVAFGAPTALGVVAGTAAFISLCSHLLADSITPMGIAPLVPLVAWHHSFELTRAANVTANLVLLTLGLFTTAGVHAVVLL